MTGVFIAGCGYVGGRLARRLRAPGLRISALARSDASADRLRAIAVAPVAGDLDEAASLANLPVGHSELYYLAPPPPHGVTDTRIAAFCAAIHPPNLPKRVVLISTTGVYGDCKGEWIDESRPLAPQVDRARRRVDAEDRLKAWSAETGVPVVILRVAGIYGPGKLPTARLQAGEPVLRAEESPYSNRVHVDDLVAACIAAMARGRDGGVYNITDGRPSTMTDYFIHVADALSLPHPPQLGLEQAQTQMGEGMLSYLAESKRIGNLRMRV